MFICRLAVVVSARAKDKVKMCHAWCASEPSPNVSVIHLTIPCPTQVAEVVCARGVALRSKAGADMVSAWALQLLPAVAKCAEEMQVQQVGQFSSCKACASAECGHSDKRCLKQAGYSYSHVWGG